ncbi:hypothetical protein MKX08_001821 [Trichoderma sp. CBMAI-0020]|nr:hypothetical protein MKX08_001821 [Trichoderma sp. CBMAI-0020]
MLIDLQPLPRALGLLYKGTNYKFTDRPESTKSVPAEWSLLMLTKPLPLYGDQLSELLEEPKSPRS